MNTGRLFLAAAGACVFATMGIARAQASNVLYDQAGWVNGTQSFVQSFNIASPGTLTVTLTNNVWPMPLASLNLLLTSATGTLGPQMGVGTTVFDIKKGDDVFAHWFGTAQGPLSEGLFSLKIEFQPAGQTAVPLPTSVVLLLSGLGLLLWQRRTPGVGSGAVLAA